VEGIVLQKDRDVGRYRDGVRRWRNGGGIICYDKDVWEGVTTLDVVVWLY
jgi:hypothetical protein